jgi:hypothetical protein
VACNLGEIRGLREEALDDVLIENKSISRV